MGYIIGIIWGLYTNISIIPIFLILIIIYNFCKIFRITKIKKFSFFDIRRYLRYFKIFFNLKIVITIILFSIISNLIVNFQNNKYKKVYENNQNVEETAIVVSSKIEKEYSNMYKIKILSSKKFFYLKIDKKNKINLEYGDKIKFSGTYQEPQTQRNYKGFDYKNYLKTQKIYGTFKSKEVKLLAKNEGNKYLSFINKITEKIKENIDKTFNKDDAALIKGLLIGDISNISDEVQEEFKISSLSHILAVSGMQVNYIAIFIKKIFERPCGKRKTKIITLIFLNIYMAITEFSPSIVRATIMECMMIFSTTVFRKNDFWNTLAFSLLIMVIYNPFIILNVGLILSYIGTIGIMIFKENFSKVFDKIKFKNILSQSFVKLKDNSNQFFGKFKLKDNSNQFFGKFKLKDNSNQSFEKLKLKSSLKQAVGITLSAQITVFPIMIYSFNMLCTYFLITNLLAETIVEPITIGGCILIFISFFSLKISKYFSYILKIPLKILLQIAKISNLPFSKIYFSTPNVFSIIIFYIIVFSINYILKVYLSEKLTTTQKRVKNLIALFKYYFKLYKKKCIFVICVIIIIFSSLKLIPNKLEVNFVDVGQGDCTFIVTPHKKTILIDGGGSEFKTDFDGGKSTLLPYILDKGYTKIDLMIITHMDSDHVGNLLTILKEIKVKNVVVAKQGENSKNYKDFLDIVKNKKINVSIVKSGDVISVEKDLNFKVIWPCNELIQENILNNNSIVCKLNYKKFSILFTGDIEKIAEVEILNKYKNLLNSDVLKVAHHGSKTSSTKEFIEAVKPKSCLIGVGKNNMFKHPSESTIKTLKENNVKIYRTDLNGEITIKVNKKGKYKITYKIH